MRQNTRLALGGFILLVLGIGIGVVLGLGRHVLDEEGRAALEKMSEAHRIVSTSYVDRVSEERLTVGAITGMLDVLDPHSVYISAERMQRVNETFNASFEGIGIAYELIDGPLERDTLAVVTVLPGGPSERAGLQSGDRIVAVDGRSTVGLSNEAVQATLKGPRGTTLALTVRRPGVPEPFEVRITRDRVALPTVTASFMAADRTGYIKISRFARTTYDEFVEALTRLKQQGMDRLVLDLRGNSGGFMEMAVQIGDEFLSEGQLIVASQSRHRAFNRASYATGGGAFERQPLIVLVDAQSASASEVLAGALQDHDRALILGERTFGKGLVQRQFPFEDGSALRLTISRFQTPSGRFIQVPYEEQGTPPLHAEAFGDTAGGEAVAWAPDSLRYRTDLGRTVMGGGGILPDRIVRTSDEADAVRELAQHAAFNAFARHWLDTHGPAVRARWAARREAFVRDFQVSDSLFAAFRAFARARGDCPALPKTAPHRASRACEFEGPMRDVIEILIKSHLARRLFDASAWQQVYVRVDPVFTKALQAWPDAEAFAAHYPVGAG